MDNVALLTKPTVAVMNDFGRYAKSRAINNSAYSGLLHKSNICETKLWKHRNFLRERTSCVNKVPTWGALLSIPRALCAAYPTEIREFNRFVVEAAA
jgi:hypothetical protein